MRLHRFEVSDKRKKLFVVEPGEDVYQALARQMSVARPHLLGAFMMMRQGDKSQTDAMMLVQSAKTAIWTRRAVVAAVTLIPINRPDHLPDRPLRIATRCGTTDKPCRAGMQTAVGTGAASREQPSVVRTYQSALDADAGCAYWRFWRF